MLKPGAKVAHTDYSVNYHTDYLSERTGLSPDHPEFVKKWKEFWAMDFDWYVNDGLRDFRYGRSTDMGHAVYAADGSDRRESAVSPFSSIEEIWAFDAVKEYGLPDKKEQTDAYESLIQERRTAFPEELGSGGFYKTIVSGAIAAFGWDLFLTALSDRKKMERVLDSFFRNTLFYLECWAETSAEVIIQHDDFVWTSGPFVHPSFYRKVIIPRYRELWKPIHAAGKKLLFCSDGNFIEFTEDIVAAGADGLIFEPCMDFSLMAERHGSEVCLVGSAVDCRDMTFGNKDTVKAQIEQTFALADRCRGLIFAVGNHLPPNIPPHMMDFYRKELLKYLDT